MARLRLDLLYSGLFSKQIRIAAAQRGAKGHPAGGFSGSITSLLIQ